MDSRTSTITLEDGTRIVVPDSLDKITTYVLQEQGDWFEDEIRFLRGLLQPGQTLVDIGANYGVYTLSLARKVGPEGKVWAFEPASQTAQLLSESIAINGTNWVHLEQQALSDHEGTAWLKIADQSELNSLASNDTDNVATTGKRAGETVSLTTLDDCLERLGWQTIDFIKIDAEGEEERILSGGQRFFTEQSPLVMFELKNGSNYHLEAISHFASLGYSCYRLIPGLDILAPFSPDEAVDGFLLNLFAAKPDRVEKLAACARLVADSSANNQREPGEEPVDWFSGIQSFPYAKALESRWTANAQHAGQSTWIHALSDWATAKNICLPIQTRYLALKQSFRLLSTYCDSESPKTRWASLARVALELGERQEAVRALGHLLESLQTDGEISMDEPFLSPCPGFDAIDPVGQHAAWLEAASWEAVEVFGSFSGFYTATAGLPRLERIMTLGFASPTIMRRLELVRRRFPSLTANNSSHAISNEEKQGTENLEPKNSIAFWFDFLELKPPLRCLDVGALALEGETDPWVQWAVEGYAEVIGFEPLAAECERLNQQAAQLGGSIHYLPWALGDGQTHTLHITNAPMTSSLFLPDRRTADLFPALGDLMQVKNTITIQTHRLDDLDEVQPVDFIKLNAQGAELMILENARNTLENASVIQCEVEFVELYEGQPLMANVDAFMRSQGFCFLRFTNLMGRPYKPLHQSTNPIAPISQVLWSNAIYIRDFRTRTTWSDQQLKTAVLILHEIYQAFDLASLLIAEIDRRKNSNLQECYLASILLSQPDLAI